MFEWYWYKILWEVMLVDYHSCSWLLFCFPIGWLEAGRTWEIWRDKWPCKVSWSLTDWRTNEARFYSFLFSMNHFLTLLKHCLSKGEIIYFFFPAQGSKATKPSSSKTANVSAPPAKPAAYRPPRAKNAAAVQQEV